VRIYKRIRRETKNAKEFYEEVKVRKSLLCKLCQDSRILFQTASREGYQDDLHDFYSEPPQPTAVSLDPVSEPPQWAAVSADLVSGALRVWPNMISLNALYRYSRTCDHFIQIPRFLALAPLMISHTTFAIPALAKISAADAWLSSQSRSRANSNVCCNLPSPEDLLTSGYL
jgi:hypothetical protein